MNLCKVPAEWVDCGMWKKNYFEVGLLLREGVSGVFL